MPEVTHQDNDKKTKKELRKLQRDIGKPKVQEAEVDQVNFTNFFLITEPLVCRKLWLSSLGKMGYLMQRMHMVFSHCVSHSLLKAPNTLNWENCQRSQISIKMCGFVGVFIEVEWKENYVFLYYVYKTTEFKTCFLSGNVLQKKCWHSSPGNSLFRCWCFSYGFWNLPTLFSFIVLIDIEAGL